MNLFPYYCYVLVQAFVITEEVSVLCSKSLHFHTFILFYYLNSKLLLCHYEKCQVHLHYDKVQIVPLRNCMFILTEHNTFMFQDFLTQLLLYIHLYWLY